MEAKVMNDMRDEGQYGIVRSGKGKGKVSKVQSKVRYGKVAEVCMVAVKCGKWSKPYLRPYRATVMYLVPKAHRYSGEVSLLPTACYD